MSTQQNKCKKTNRLQLKTTVLIFFHVNHHYIYIHTRSPMI